MSPSLRPGVPDWFDGAGNGQRVDVLKMLDSQAGTGLHHLVDAGALVSLGLTSDGGALGVTVTVDGRWRREYFRDEDHLIAWIAEAIPAVQHARGHEAPATAVPRKRGARSKSL